MLDFRYWLTIATRLAEREQSDGECCLHFGVEATKPKGMMLSISILSVNSSTDEVQQDSCCHVEVVDCA